MEIWPRQIPSSDDSSFCGFFGQQPCGRCSWHFALSLLLPYCPVRCGRLAAFSFDETQSEIFHGVLLLTILTSDHHSPCRVVDSLVKRALVNIDGSRLSSSSDFFGTHFVVSDRQHPRAKDVPKRLCHGGVVSRKMHRRNKLCVSPGQLPLSETMMVRGSLLFFSG